MKALLDRTKQAFLRAWATVRWGQASNAASSSKADCVHVLPDANFFLHFRAWETNWLKLLSAKRLVIIIPAVLLTELDEQKDRNTIRKIKKRAQTALAKFSELPRTGVLARLGENVEIRFIPREPQIDFRKHELDPLVRDDRYIANLIEMRKQIGGHRLVLLSDDVGIRLKADNRSFEVMDPPEELRCPEEPDPIEAQLRQANEELAALKLRLPELVLEFSIGGPLFCFHVVAPAGADEEFKKVALNSTMQQHPKWEPVPPVPADFTASFMRQALVFLRPPKEVLDAYNSALEAFFKDYEDYLTKLVAFRRLVVIPVELKLANNGGAPAEDIDLFLTIPPETNGVLKKELPAEPIPPQPPQRRTTIEALAMDAALVRPPVSLIPPPRLPGNLDVTGPYITKGKTTEVRFHLRKVKHGMVWTLPTFYVLIKDHAEAKSFDATYLLNTDSHPKPFEGKLHLWISGSGGTAEVRRRLRALKGQRHSRPSGSKHPPQ